MDNFCGTVEKSRCFWTGRKFPLTTAMIFSAEQRARIHPCRSLPCEPLKVDAKKSWAALKKLWQRPKWASLIGHTPGVLGEQLEALKGRVGESLVDPLQDGLLYLILMHPEDYDSDRLRHLVDYHVSSRGILFALQALLQLERFHWEEPTEEGYQLVEGEGEHSYALKDGWLGPWHRLRCHLSRASEADYQEALACARSLWPAGSPVDQAELAYLFPDADFAAQIADQSDYACVAFSLRDPAALDRMVRRLPYENFVVYTEGWEDQCIATRLSFLALAGPECLPTLQHLFEEDTDDTGEVLALIPQLPALTTLCSNLDRDGVRESLQNACRLHPSLALPAIAQVAASRNKSASHAQILLTRMLRSEGASLLSQVPSLPDAARRLVENLWQKLAPPTEAPLESLPADLVDPPWLKKQPAKKASAKLVMDLSPLEVPPQERWPEELREEWLLPLETWKVEAETQSATPQEHAQGMLEDLSLDLKYLRLLEEDLPELWAELATDLKDSGWGYILNCLVAPDPLALHVWNHAVADSWSADLPDLQAAAARFGLAGLPGLQTMTKEKPAWSLQFMLPFGHPDQAPIAAAALKRKKDRAAAEKWLRTWPEVAAIALIPRAFVKAAREREAAEAGLRWLGRHGFGALLSSVAERYGVGEGVQGILDFDPMLEYPAKAPKMPEFWEPGGFVRPRLKNGQALPLPAVQHLGSMLAFSSLETPYVGIGQIRELCTPESLDEFAWDLFSAWSFAGYPSAGAWAMRALGLIGGDASARKLAPLLRQWPGEGGNARAVAGLDVLEAIGSDVALMHLNGLAQKVKFRGLQEAARQKVEAIAEARGLTGEELADRLVPDLGLDEQGSLTLDFGPRQFTVVFDELLRPGIRDGQGKLLKSFPKANKSDDPEKSGEATTTYKALQKDVKTLAGQQVSRLEQAMCQGRRWTAEVFRLFLAGHPLVGHLVRRLWWGAWDGTQLRQAFRVAEDGTFADLQDSFWELPEDLQVGVVHPYFLSPEKAQNAAQILADYNILQPFRQVGREVFLLSEQEKTTAELSRFEGKTVSVFPLLGLEHRGWRRGAAEDGGMSMCYVSPLSGTQELRISIDPGIIAGMVDEYPSQTLGKLYVARHRAWQGDGTLLGAVDPVRMSEALRDLTSLG